MRRILLSPHITTQTGVETSKQTSAELPLLSKCKIHRVRNLVTAVYGQKITMFYVALKMENGGSTQMIQVTSITSARENGSRGSAQQQTTCLYSPLFFSSFPVSSTFVQILLSLLFISHLSTPCH
jgi:hypothetical protein